MDHSNLNVPVGLLWTAVVAVCTAAVMVVKAGLAVMKAARSWFQQSDRLNHAADIVLGPGTDVPKQGQQPHPDSLIAKGVYNEGQLERLRKRMAAAEMHDRRPDITDPEAVAKFFSEHLDTGQFQAIVDERAKHSQQNRVASEHRDPPKLEPRTDPRADPRPDTRWKGEPK
jgi:hypothetical protein